MCVDDNLLPGVTMTTIPRLLCDKITITSRDNNNDHARTICDRLIRLAEEGSIERFRVKSGKRNLISYSFPVSGSTFHSTIRFEVGARFSNSPHYRLELNPSKLGASGFAEALAMLADITDGHIETIIRTGTVTRCDIAIDIEGLAAKDVIARSKGQQKFGIYTDRYGNPETLYLGAQRGNRTVIYTRSEIPGIPILRVERRLKDRIPFEQLAFLPNPFSRVQLVDVDILRPHVGNVDADLFFDSVRLRGFTHALKKLPRGRRRATEKALRDPANSLLPTIADLWLDWPRLLVSYGFGHLLTLPGSEIPTAPRLPEPAANALATLWSKLHNG